MNSTKQNPSIITCAAALLIACGGAQPQPAEELKDTDARLAAAAAALAPEMKSASFRAQLDERLSVRETGDYEVFLADLASIILDDGRTVEDVLAPSGVLDVYGVHLASPGGVPHADAGLPLVTWVPATKAPARLEMFDVDGTKHEVDASRIPEVPVFVVALNERFGDSFVTADDVETAGNGLWGCSGCRRVTLDSIRIFTKSEPWYKGDPEIYVKCYDTPYINPTLADVNPQGGLELANVNKMQTTYAVNLHLITMTTNQFYDSTCWVLERDGGPGHPTDPDDSLGSARVSFSDPTPKTYVMAGAEIRLSAFIFGRW